MADDFDPYHKWLSIPPEEQPPNHYRLLGLNVFEDDQDVIEGAADRQMAHVRGFQSGQRAELSQRILNEIAAAKTALLQPEKKKAYDAQLKLRLDACGSAGLEQPERPLDVVPGPTYPAPRPVPPAPLPPVHPPPARNAAVSAAPAMATAMHAMGSSVGPVIHPRTMPGRRSSAPLIAAALAGCALLAAAAAIAIIFVGSFDGGAVAVNDSTAETAVSSAGNSAARTNVAGSQHDSQPRGASQQPAGADVASGPSAQPPVEAPPGSGAPADAEEDDSQALQQETQGTSPDAPDETPVAAQQPDSGEGAEEPEPAPRGPRKHPVPDKAVRDAQRRRIADIFRVDQAKTLAEKADLAAELLRTAAETDEPDARFALLNMARELAAGTGRVRLAFDAIDQMAASFEFDADGVRLASLKQAADAPLPAAAKFEVVTVGVEAIDRWLQNDQFAFYESLMPVLQELTRRANDPQVMKALNERRRLGDEMHSRYKRVRPALDVLKSRPDDPDANTTVGKYIGFVKGDWRRGVPMLAKGADEALRQAATAELTPPASGGEMLALADLWWALSTSPEAEVAAFAKARGGYWYSQAARELTGLDKAKADRRVSEAGNIAAAAGPLRTEPVHSPAVESAAASPMDLLAKIDVARDSIQGQWTLEDGKLRSPVARHARIRVPVRPGEEYELEMIVEPVHARGRTLVMGLVAAGPRKFAAAFGSWQDGKFSGLEFLDGKPCFENETTYARPVLVPRKQNRVIYTVRKDGVRVVANDRVIVDWQGDPQRLDIDRNWDIPDKDALFIGAFESELLIHSLMLRPLPPPRPPAAHGVRQGLVGHWAFDERKGATTRDSAGQNHGAVRGATWTRRGGSGALSFDGQDDFVEIGNPDELNFEGPITMAAWVRPRDRAAGITFMNILCHAGNGREVYLRISNSMYAAGGYAGTHIPVEARLPDEDIGAWIHFAAVYDGKAWHLYRNGDSILSRITTHGCIKVNGNWVIGASSDGKSRLFKGDIDDVRIYSRALSAEELAELHRATAAGDGDSAEINPRGSGALENLTPPPAAARPLPGVDVIIVKALFGAGSAQKDVTDILRKALQDDPFAPIQADDRAMGDPASGQQKQLVIQLQSGRRPQTVSLSHQQPLPLPAPPAGGLTVKDAAKTFHIVAARYGAGLTWVDVTDAARKLVISAATPVRWEGLTKEDPWFGVGKHYAVWFDYEGRRFVRLIPDAAHKALLP